MPHRSERVKRNAEEAFSDVIKKLPFNRSNVYVKIHLENSRCDLYLPYRDKDVENAHEWSKGVKILIELLEL